MSNDRFKFRVWDEEYKDYLPLSDCKLDAITGELVKRSLFQENRYIIEQCTGLRDKNGKLIFENDIVETVYRDGSTGKRRVVYVVEDARFMLTPFPLKEYPIYWDCEKYILSTFEIIGNVHEMEVDK